MSWPNHKLREFRPDLKHFTPEKKQEFLNNRRRTVARGQCTRCKERPRASTMTICYKCHYADVKAYRAKKKNDWIEARKREFVDQILEHRCAVCREWLLDPFTRKGRIRYACSNCYKALWADWRINREVKPFAVIREAIRSLKIKAGILPKTAWDSLKTRRRYEKFWREVRPQS